MKSDIEISQEANLKNILDVANSINIEEKYIEQYGKYKAKIDLKLMEDKKDEDGKLILVTAITPTSAGEGKTTTSIGLADALRKLNKNSVLALREPSLGPVFGIKGGATGGGFSQVAPMEDINLHFTGDIHAISIANNLIAALIDNHIQQGNILNIDPRTISWKRCLDLNDRSLRNIIIGLGGKIQGVPREDHFTIAVASEIMAIVCLSKTITELKERIDRIVIGQNYNKENITFGQLKCTGAVAALLKDVIKPNLVQTLEKNPAFVHGGPFANIAHGCNSVNATLCALASGDYVVTEAGFAADLGAEKFLDIKCRSAGLKPDAVVIVATIRALKMHGGLAKTELSGENCQALEKGFANLKTHIENISKFGLPVVVAINKFITDTDKEISLLKDLCQKIGAKAVLSEGWEKGGQGTEELAKTVAEIADSGKANYHPLYDLDLPLTEKIKTIAKEIYRAADVEFDSSALKKLKTFEEAGYGKLPVCIAKTQNSISHDPKLIGAPSGFTFPVRDVQLYAGAGFVVALAGDIMTMPGLPKAPAALNIDVDDNGIISGLF